MDAKMTAQEVAERPTFCLHMEVLVLPLDMLGILPAPWRTSVVVHAVRDAAEPDGVDQIGDIVGFQYLRLLQADRPPRSICIYSDEIIFPWELVAPFVPGKRFRPLEPLGVAHILGRWLPGDSIKPVPQSLRVRNFLVFNPHYDPPNTLPWAEEEADKLAERFRATLVAVPDMESLRENVLSRDDVQILHFTGHGNFDPVNADLNSLMLEGGDTWDALSAGADQVTQVAQPIFYLNACTAGRVGPTAGRMGGFAANLLRGGCSGVIAPYWPVNDARAMDFSLELYDNLQSQRSIGEALQELRRANPTDPTYRAYAFFGDPWARSIFS
jgi:hypothetical protein